MRTTATASRPAPPPSVASRVTNDVPLSADAYLAMERASEERHEFIDGFILSMPGASLQHTLIATNTLIALQSDLHGTDCQTLSSGLGVALPEQGTYTYPDVLVFCGDPEVDTEHHDLLLNPTLLVEVLSESTGDYDRGEKFRRYRTLDSLQEYVIIDQYTSHVEHYVRQDTGWLLTETDALDDTLALSSAPATLTIADIYENVFPTEPSDEETAASSDENAA